MLPVFLLIKPVMLPLVQKMLEWEKLMEAKVGYGKFVVYCEY